jgi:peptide/nickel transport system ATP-binding protein
MPAGCAFAPRCDYAADDPCTTQTAQLIATGPDRASRCVRVQRGDQIMTAGGLLREMA